MNPNPIDDEGPELISYSIQENTIELGILLYIDYDATDDEMVSIILRLAMRLF